MTKYLEQLNNSDITNNLSQFTQNTQ